MKHARNACAVPDPKTSVSSVSSVSNPAPTKVSKFCLVPDATTQFMSEKSALHLGLLGQNCQEVIPRTVCREPIPLYPQGVSFVKQTLHLDQNCSVSPDCFIVGWLRAQTILADLSRVGGCLLNGTVVLCCETHSNLYLIPSCFGKLVEPR